MKTIFPAWTGHKGKAGYEYLLASEENKGFEKLIFMYFYCLFGGLFDTDGWGNQKGSQRAINLSFCWKGQCVLNFRSHQGMAKNE